MQALRPPKFTTLFSSYSKFDAVTSNRKAWRESRTRVERTKRIKLTSLMDLRQPKMMDEALQLMGWIANMLSSCTESLHWVSELSLFPLLKLPRILKAAVSASALKLTYEFLKNWEHYHLQPSLTLRFSASSFSEKFSVTFKIWVKSWTFIAILLFALLDIARWGKHSNSWQASQN